MYENALKISEDLVKHPVRYHNERERKTPRFQIQLSYIMWRLYRQKLTEAFDKKNERNREFLLEEASRRLSKGLEITLDAILICEDPKYSGEFERCYRLALSNGVILCCLKEDLTKAENTLNKLLNVIKDEKDIDRLGVYLSAKAMFNWLKSNNLINNIKNNKKIEKDYIINTIRELHFDLVKNEIDLNNIIEYYDEDSEGDLKFIIDIIHNKIEELENISQGMAK